MKFGQPPGHSWFGYGLILYMLCTCLTWSSSCWIIPMKQNFRHSLKIQCGNLNFVTFILLLLLLLLFSSNQRKINVIICTTGLIDTVGVW